MGKLKFAAWLCVILEVVPLTPSSQAGESPVIVLPPPMKSSSATLVQALENRRTVREFEQQALPVAMLSDLLWAAFGINRPPSGGRTAPSAFNAQDIDLYVAQATGLFRYQAEGHKLERLLDEDIRSDTGSQEFVRDAPVSLLLVSDLSRLSRAPTADREFYAAFDAGCITQNIYLFCAGAGLGTVVHDLDRKRLAERIGLRREQKIIFVQCVGYPREIPK